jgi:hypothetical protein
MGDSPIVDGDADRRIDGFRFRVDPSVERHLELPFAEASPGFSRTVASSAPPRSPSPLDLAVFGGCLRGRGEVATRP